MRVTSNWDWSSACDLACSCASREAAGVSVRGLREPDPRPVHPPGVPGQGQGQGLITPSQKHHSYLEAARGRSAARRRFFF